MKEEDITALSAGWISRYEIVERFGDKAPEAERTFPAFLAVERLVRSSPEDAWQVILRIIEMTENEFVLENLAAGPLESLLTRHGMSYIDRVESRVAVDAKFKWILGGIWQGGMADEIWSRVESAIGNGESRSSE